MAKPFDSCVQLGTPGHHLQPRTKACNGFRHNHATCVQTRSVHAAPVITFNVDESANSSHPNRSALASLHTDLTIHVIGATGPTHETASHDGAKHKKSQSAAQQLSVPFSLPSFPSVQLHFT